MKKFWFSFFGVLVLLTACKSAPSQRVDDTPQVELESESTIEVPPENANSSTETVILTIVYTNDEHGWMAGEEVGSGAAELTGLWATEFPESDVVLPLSGGDNWTGPAISTWFQGESMVEAMNAMGYAASAIGNHEFDFSPDIMAIRIKQADFPYLGANIHYSGDGEIPTDLGIQPYTIVDAKGLKIGMIGLAYQDTPTVTNPLYVAELEFSDYEAALREYVPELQEAGVDLIVVPGHICEWALSGLARDVEDLGIAMFGGGHCNELFADQEGGAVLLGGGFNLRSYAFATYEVEPGIGEHHLIDYGTEDNIGGKSHPQVAEIVAHWQELTDQELDVTIGYLENEIEQQSDQMAALTTEAWLWVYPADAAITNWGGMRDRIPAGEVTISDIISVMPFDNVLMDVALTGTEMVEVLKSGDHLPAISGLTWDGGQWILNKSREPLDPESTYHLLVTDFMYAGGDNYRIAEFDPDAYNTAINWRQPVIDWILAQESNPEKPLDGAVQGLLD